MDIKLRLTELECNVIAELFDIAVKSGGMRVAPAAVALLNKIDAARKPRKAGHVKAPAG